MVPWAIHYWHTYYMHVVSVLMTMFFLKKDMLMLFTNLTTQT